MPNREKLSEFIAWCQQHITGDEKGQPQIFLDRLFQAFGQPGSLDVGGHPEFRVRKDKEDRSSLRETLITPNLSPISSANG